MWWGTKIVTRITPNELIVDLKFEHAWNIRSSYDLNTRWFHVELLQINDAILQKHARWPIVICHEYCSWFQSGKTYENENQTYIYFKLWKYNTYFKVRSICLQNKWSRRIHMNKKWSNCERNLQRLEGVVSFNSLWERLIFVS
jgi:hypothetical protein